MKRLLIFVSFLGVACHPDRITAPSVDLALAVRVEPSAQYAQWWSDLEACSGMWGTLSAVSFYEVGGYDFPVKGHDFWGYWFEDGNKIVLATAHAQDKTLVEHEMMHALLQTGLHPALYFNGACGDLTYPNE
ncbi:MAG: hypothetical protein ABI408_06355 [Gemmatimonadaceae bacterium]